MLATFTLPPAGAKRLIARGIVQMPEISRALKSGRVIVAGGTTNAYVAEEMGFLDPLRKYNYTAGVVTGGIVCITPPEERIAPVCLEQGVPISMPWEEFLNDFERDDVFLKGANALDANGRAGIILGAANGGTIGASLGRLAACGAHLIVPVGHEKMIPSCERAAGIMGIKRVDDSIGMRCGFMMLPYGRVFTEIDALYQLFKVEATVVAAGGVAGSEGAVTLAVTGEQDRVEAALALAIELRREKPVTGKKNNCAHCIMPEKCLFGRNVKQSR